jgi:hypothetical protein
VLRLGRGYFPSPPLAHSIASGYPLIRCFASHLPIPFQCASLLSLIKYVPVISILSPSLHAMGLSLVPRSPHAGPSLVFRR